MIKAGRENPAGFCSRISKDVLVKILLNSLENTEFAGIFAWKNLHSKIGKLHNRVLRLLWLNAKKREEAPFSVDKNPYNWYSKYGYRDWYALMMSVPCVRAPNTGSGLLLKRL